MQDDINWTELDRSVQVLMHDIYKYDLQFCETATVQKLSSLRNKIENGTRLSKFLI